MALTQEEMEQRNKLQTDKVIDIDVHPLLRSMEDLYEYFDDTWKDFFRASKVSSITGQPFLVPVGGGLRMDSYPPEGGPPGSSPEFMKTQLLDQHSISHAILFLSSGYQISSLPQEQWAIALASACNDFLIDKWLSADSRYKGSVLVATQDPQAAAREIDRVGSHPGMVQVGLGIHSPMRGYGDKMYDPIWEAAVRNNLVVCFHVSVATGLYKNNSTGPTQNFPEFQSTHNQTFQGQMASMIFGGVFEKFPELKVAFIEGGFSWVPHMMFTMDTHWKAARREVPWVKKYPSEYVREHFWFGTQPIIKTANPKHVLQLIEMIGVDRMIFASDYPHWEFDSPQMALNHLPKEMREKILFENAKKMYGFED
ncbi:amidohydrolase family protein [Neobacillus niacini]|uniref:amidohydrolase family protein n=1 Tax=Neobacillus niacini TaxID=86668 RepID=UPI002FFF20B7